MERKTMSRKDNSTVNLNHIDEKDVDGNKFFDFCKDYEGVILNNDIPYFNVNGLVPHFFEKFSNLDIYGRCGEALACICKESLPIKKRAAIGQVIPSGWHSVKYDCIKGGYLYNRSHLIGFQLTGQNSNEKNLITGTRFVNVNQMLKYENLIVDYVKSKNNHVLYRVTPVFENENLVASGVILEALSLEDRGEGICFNRYIYNIQPQIHIDYKTGNSKEIV